MHKLKYLIIIGVYLATCYGSEPFKVAAGSVNFIVYYPSRYRGICVGALVSPTTVITAAICVTHATSDVADTRPINVVTGASYRHQRRGIRVQVTKIILPKMTSISGRPYLIQTSPALMLLFRKVPDIIAEIPLRPISIAYKRDEEVPLHEECVMLGWHFFYKGDIIYPSHKFLLLRNLRAQFMKTAKMNLWCSTLALKFQKALSNLGYNGNIEKKSKICIRDPDKTGQPCHGMYGAPLICRGSIVGMLTAPDAQWTNCTGFSNIVHLMNADHLQNFMNCTSKLFSQSTLGTNLNNWETLKRNLVNGDYKEYDYIPAIYDKILSDSESE